MSVRLLMMALWAAVGCAATAPAITAGGGPAAPPPPEDATAYYPLVPGWKWAYQVETEKDRAQAGNNVLAIYAVLERIGDTAIVQAGEGRLSYVVLPAGIARREGMNVGDFLLKTPVRPGTTWPLASGEAKVVAVGRTETVPGGTFPACATIEESRTEPQRVVRTVYAAGVGPILVEMQVYDPTTGQFRTGTRAVLLGVTRPGEDPLGQAEGVSVPSGRGNRP